MSKWRIKTAVLVGFLVVGGGAALVLTAEGATGASAPSTAASAPATVAAASAPLVSGSEAKFEFLSQQTSNRCSLERAALEAMPNSMRLQGSCCFPMNLGAYRSQVQGLRRYVSISQVPRDPYDVPVSLAKRLLGYERGIHLSSVQRRIYAQAMRMSVTRGPCCCHCWRWDAFRGLSNYLIARRGFSASQLAHVIDLVEGCGGPKGS